MSESGIYIRVDKNSVLLEDLDLINRNEWLNGLDKAGLIRTINILCNTLHESNEKIKNLENTGKIEKLGNQKKEFIDYLGNEKDRLVRECSQIYEDSLGKTRLVNEDIFNEVDTILSKYKEITGDDK